VAAVVFVYFAYFAVVSAFNITAPGQFALKFARAKVCEPRPPETNGPCKVLLLSAVCWREQKALKLCYGAALSWLGATKPHANAV
jgi:hypothetical protein